MENYVPLMIPVFVLGIVQALQIGFLLSERAKRLKAQLEQRIANEALTESEAKNTAILNALPDMMFLLDEEGTYLEWFANETRNLYVPPHQFIGKNMREIMPPQLAVVFADKFGTVLTTGDPVSVEYSLPIAGKTRCFEARIVKCGKRRLLCIVRDLTDKKHAEQDLQRLSARLLTLQDEERRRISRELHDVTAQNLFAITINLESLRQQMAGLSSARRVILVECQNLCEQSLQEVRTLSYTLHPPALDRLGLLPSLQWYIDVFGKRSGMDIKFQAAQDVARLPLEMETDIFRIVQEGLCNIVRHSGSHTATVRLRQRGSQFVLQIRDHGRGLPDNVSRSGNGNGSGFGVGLPSMRERLRRWGGHLHIRSGSDGVLLLVHVPIPLADHQHEANVDVKQIQNR